MSSSSTTRIVPPPCLTTGANRIAMHPAGRDREEHANVAPAPRRIMRSRLLARFRARMRGLSHGPLNLVVKNGSKMRPRVDSSTAQPASSTQMATHTLASSRDGPCSSWRRGIPRRRLLARTVPAAGEFYVAICVDDTGSGMDESTLARIFDRFFTTKFTGPWLRPRISARHRARAQGSDHRRYSSGCGHIVSRVLPGLDRQRAGAIRFPAVVRQGGGTIPAVDDEDVVRRMARTALERLGYLITATNGKRAVEYYSSEPERIQIVLRRLRCPVMGGEETLRRLHGITPGLPVVAMSGFHEPGKPSSALEAGSRGSFRNPSPRAKLAIKLTAARRASVA